MLSVTKTAYEKLIANYPEQSDIISTSLLFQYGLNQNGEDVSNAAGGRKPGGGGDDEGQNLLREAIKVRHCNGSSESLAQRSVSELSVGP